MTSSQNIFDETIFTDGRTFKMYSDQIEVNNRIDAFLLSRFNINYIYVDMLDQSRAAKSQQTNDIFSCSRIPNNNVKIYVNPIRPGIGLNIYTINMLNKRINQSEHINQIEVVDETVSVENKNNIEYIELDVNKDYNPNGIYTISSSLTTYEMALLLKFYAISYEHVRISRDLYSLINNIFKDQRNIFVYDRNGIIQNQKKELLYKNEIIEIPINNISGPVIYF